MKDTLQTRKDYAMSILFDNYDAEDAYYIFCEYLADPDAPAFDPDDYPEIDYDFEEYVRLEKIGEDERIYYTIEEVVEMLNEPSDDRTGTFDHDEKGIYQLITAPHGYRVVGWTDEMKEWIADHRNRLALDDEE